MHQPYYKNLLTQETGLPWVRLHGVKDYLDMVEILDKYPKIHQTFCLDPWLAEQIDDYTEDVQFSLMGGMLFPGNAFDKSNRKLANEVIGSMKVTF